MMPESEVVGGVMKTVRIRVLILVDSVVLRSSSISPLAICNVLLLHVKPKHTHTNQTSPEQLLSRSV